MKAKTGAIFLSDKDGHLKQIAAMQRGITFNLFEGEPIKVIKVTINVDDFNDEFFFTPGRPVFHHISSRNYYPELTKIYMKYFLETNTYSPSGLIKFVANQFFKSKKGFK